jgi:hypothetical protein
MSQKSISEAKQFLGGMIIKCDHCGTADGYTPDNSTYSIVENVGMKELTEEFHLKRLDQLERWKKEDEMRDEAKESARVDAIWRRLETEASPFYTQSF